MPVCLIVLIVGILVVPAIVIVIIEIKHAHTLFSSYFQHTIVLNLSYDPACLLDTGSCQKCWGNGKDECEKKYRQLKKICYNRMRICIKNTKEDLIMIQQRNIAVCIILSIVTCGIYGIYWFICLSNDANTVSNTADGTSGGLAVVLTIITCGIYGWYWAYKQGEKIDNAKVSRGMPSGSSSVVYLILSIFGLAIVAWALMQNELNQLA